MSPKSLALMHGASRPPSDVMVGTTPTNIPWDPNLVPSRLFWTGAVMCMTVMFLSCMIETDSLNDEILPGDPGPMMGIERVQPHHLIVWIGPRISLDRF